MAFSPFIYIHDLCSVECLMLAAESVSVPGKIEQYEEHFVLHIYTHPYVHRYITFIYPQIYSVAL